MDVTVTEWSIRATIKVDSVLASSGRQHEASRAPKHDKKYKQETASLHLEVNTFTSDHRIVRQKAFAWQTLH
jgi:hypothetical protein